MSAREDAKPKFLERSAKHAGAQELELPVISARVDAAGKTIVVISTFEVAKAMLKHLGIPAYRTVSYELLDGSVVTVNARRSNRRVARGLYRTTRRITAAESAIKPRDE
jgi:hypothetical protein